MSTIFDLIKECPEITVTLKFKDLVEANKMLIAETKSELEHLISDAQAETYPSRKKVMEILDVSEATLWRWNKAGYLVPINCGGKRRYRMSDVEKILKNGKEGTSYERFKH